MPNRRKLLYGRKATEKEIVEEICRLVTGDEFYNIPPLTLKEIRQQLGFDKKTVYNYVQKGIDKYRIISRDRTTGWIQRARQTQLQLEFRTFDKYHHTILSDPLVAEWRQDLLTRNGGVPVRSWRNRILALEHVCNTCKVTPRELIISSKHTEKIMKDFAEKLRERKLVYRTKQHKKLQDLDMRGAVYYRVMAVRDFCGFYGITWKRGINNIMSGKVPGHGKYSDIRLTMEQTERADEFIKQQWGLDSDIYRWFFVGMESC